MPNQVFLIARKIIKFSKIEGLQRSIMNLLTVPGKFLPASHVKNL